MQNSAFDSMRYYLWFVTTDLTTSHQNCPSLACSHRQGAIGAATPSCVAIDSNSTGRCPCPKNRI